MTEEIIEKAAQFLVTMRPGDRYHPNQAKRLDAYRWEVRSYLQVLAALELAGCPLTIYPQTKQ